MDREEIQAKLDVVNRQIEADEHAEFVHYCGKDKFFSMKCPEKDAWIEKLRKAGMLDTRISKDAADVNTRLAKLHGRG